MSSQNTSGAYLLHSSCTRAIFIVLLAINDKHMLPIEHFPTLGVLKINLQVNKHHRLNTSQKPRTTQHSHQDNIDTSRDSCETSTFQNDKSKNMINNHATIMSPS